MSPRVLIGRDTEVMQLRTVMQQAMRGRGRPVVVEGEPGIGKSALLDVVATGCDELGARVLRGSAEEMERRLPFAAISSCLGIGTPAADARVQWISSVLRGDSDKPDFAVNQEAAVTEAIQDLLEQWCADGPVALILDDLQWADPASLLVLHRLGRTVKQLPLLLVGACRPIPRDEELERLLRSLDARGLVTITLAPLGEDAVNGLVEHLTGAPAGPRLRSLVAGATGNPLYVTELVGALLREGRIRLAGGVAELTPAAGPDAGPDPDGAVDEPVPQSLPSAIMRKLHFLSQRARDVLQVAAVLGPGLKVTELSVILDSPASELMGVVHEAAAAGLLTDSGAQLAFRHDLIRQALIENVPVAVRTALQLQAAQALAGNGAQVERVAHYLLAGESLAAWSLDWLRESADSLIARAPGLASDLLSRALEQTEADDRRGPTLRLQLARALLSAGWPGRSERVARAALATNRDPGREGTLRWLIARSCFQQGRLREAEAVSREALESTRLTRSEAARFRHFAAQCRLTLGQIDLPMEEALAEAMIAQGDPDSTAHGLYYLSGVRYMQWRLEECLNLMERAGITFMEHGTEPDWDLPHWMFRAYCLVELDRSAEAEKAFEAGLRHAERQGSIYLSWYHLGKARMHFLDGRWDDALAEIQAGMDTLDTPGRRHGRQVLRGLLSQAALIAVHRGDMATFAALADQPHSTGRPTFYDYLVRWTEALAWEAQGRPEDALASLLQFWDENRGGRPQRGLHYLCPDLTRLAVTLGKPEQARRVSADLTRVVDKRPTPILRNLEMLCRGLAEGDPDLLLAAAAAFADSSRPLYQAHARENAAAVLAELGRTNEARVTLASALELYDSLDAAWDSARAKARLREFGIRSRKHGVRQRTRTGWDALTDTERRVAALVAEGHSNPDIAARMFISRRTVQSHVSSILNKLNCTSRVELAVAASRHEGE